MVNSSHSQNNNSLIATLMITTKVVMVVRCLKLSPMPNNTNSRKNQLTHTRVAIKLANTMNQRVRSTQKASREYQRTQLLNLRLLLLKAQFQLLSKQIAKSFKPTMEVSSTPKTAVPHLITVFLPSDMAKTHSPTKNITS